MPYPNEHAARQYPPEMFERFRRGAPEGFPDGVSAIYGFLPKDKGGGSKIQALRFDRRKWTPAKAKRWLRENDFKDTLEEATGKTEQVSMTRVLISPPNREKLSTSDLQSGGLKQPENVNPRREDNERKLPRKPERFIITVQKSSEGNKYVIGGMPQRTLKLQRGKVYEFDQSHRLNTSHELRFSTTEDGTHGKGSRYTKGVSTNKGEAGGTLISSLKVDADTPSTLYYYCAKHPGMGGKVEVRGSAKEASSRSEKRRYKPGSAADDRDQRTPAPPKDRRRGSRDNRPGSAGRGSSGASIKVPAAAETSMKKKVEEHNAKHGDKAGKRVTLGMLKKVWRRGAGAFSGSHRPNMTRAQWAMARVNHFLHLVRTGSPKDSKYVQDNDVLPKGHRRSTRKCHTIVVVEANAKPFSNIPDNKPNEKFSVPKAVKADAKLGLEMHSEFKRGGTDVGLTTARRLVRADSVPYYGRHGVKHIANYFNRHEGDLKAEGAKPGDKGYPSAGLIAWKLWGGWPGKRWAQGIVERVENRKKPKKIVIRPPSDDVDQ